MPHSALGIATSIFFAGATLSGALGGLLALGLRQMAGIGGLGGWAWSASSLLLRQLCLTSTLSSSSRES